MDLTLWAVLLVVVSVPIGAAAQSTFPGKYKRLSMTVLSRSIIIIIYLVFIKNRQMI